VQLLQDWSNMFASTSSSNLTSGGVLCRLYFLQEVVGNAAQQRITVVGAACNKRLVSPVEYAPLALLRSEKRRGTYGRTSDCYITLTARQFYQQVHHACLSFVGVRQMAPPLTEVADIQLQLTTHLSTPKG